MRIEFERTGWFAGIRFAAAIDTETLPPDDARALQDLVAEADFFRLPARLVSPAPGADRFQYRITVESGGQRRTLEAGEAALPETLRSLVERLTQIARRR